MQTTKGNFDPIYLAILTKPLKDQLILLYPNTSVIIIHNFIYNAFVVH